MFTGIIEQLGTIREIKTRGETLEVTIEAKEVLSDVSIGDSIAVNGVCLTVTSYTSTYFTADVMPETFRKTSLQQLDRGSKVNLERAMLAGGRFGGHIVQGHVDGTGVITAIETEQNAVLFSIRPHDSSLFQYMFPQGSIALDGISLTLVKADGNELAVSIIPHTLSETVLQFKKKGDLVNLECDVLGKYVKQLLHFQNKQENKETIDKPFLEQHGFV